MVKEKVKLLGPRVLLPMGSGTPVPDGLLAPLFQEKVGRG